MYVIIANHRYGKSYWTGEGFGSYVKSVKYKDKKSAAKASVEEAKKWMWQNRDNLVYYPDYGLPYTFKLPENSNEI